MSTARPLFQAVALYVLLGGVFLQASRAQAAPVSEEEALEIARFWHAAEVNLYYKKGWNGDPSWDYAAYHIAGQWIGLS